MVRKRVLTTLLTFAILFMASVAMAATSVSWLTPPNGTTYDVGTIVNPQGQASGSGITGGTGLDLMLVIDTSGSMFGEKLTAAKNAAIALINALPDNTTQIGIVEFDSTANLYRQLQDLTTNKTALISAVNALTAGGATAIGSAISVATTELTGIRAIAGHAKMQVLLSDGLSNTGINPLTAADAAATAGITIHTVGVPGHDVYTMQEIADRTGGTYTNVIDLSTLVGIFAGTGGNLVSLDHVDIELPDGTWIYDIATDGLGNFILPDWAIALGINTFTAHAYGTDGTIASAVLTLNGQNPVPEPGTMLLLGTGLTGLVAARRRKAAKKA